MIEVQNLTRYYGHFPAVQDVSFSIEDGQIIGLLGLNGAGKSTTLKCLAGLLTPSSGTVTINGVDVVAAPESLKRSIGFLPESPPVYADMTVSDFVVYVGQLKGMSKADARKRLPEAIELAGLQGREDQVIGTLSHGFRKRVGIAQAVIHDPKLVILDEPISGLDPKQIREMRKVIRRLGEGRVVIVSSHILGEISQTCDRLLVLHKGRLQAQGTEQQLAKRLGDSKIVITVRGESAKLMAWLGSHKLVESATAREVSGPYASAVVDLHGDSREQLLGELVGAGFGIRLVEVPDTELEEVFLGLTRDDAALQGGA